MCDNGDPAGNRSAADSTDDSTGHMPGETVSSDDTTTDDTTEDENVDQLAALGEREGWQVEGSAARVHYSGATDRYSIEFYEPSECTLYWKVPPADAGETAVPVGRSTVPTPLRERIREDLATAGIDPDIDRRSL